MDKILFLDIDGCLNHHNALTIYAENSILEDCVAILDVVVDMTGCKIVIISNWAQVLPVEKLSERLYEKGLQRGCIIDAIKPVNIGDSDIVTGIEKDVFIKEYIHQNEIKNFVIVDDDFEKTHHFTGRVVKPN